MATHRKLVVDGIEYRWTRNQSYALGRDQVSVWIEGHHRAILQVQFCPSADPDRAQYLDDMADGWIHSDLRLYNLNRPAIAAALVRSARAHGWEPLGLRPLILDGFALFDEQPAAFPHERSDRAWLELATDLLEAAAAAAAQPPHAWLRVRALVWPTLLQADEWVPALTLAGLIDLEVLLVDREALDPARIAELLIQADARQAQGRPGGLVLTTWLLHQPIGSVELDDLRAWTKLLQTRA